MKYCYYGSFVPGMKELVAETVRERLKDVSILKLLDGAIIFETETSYDRLNFFCFNNIFALIDILEFKNPGEFGGNGFGELHIRKILTAEKGRGSPSALSERARAVIALNNGKIKTFRLVFSRENRPMEAAESARRDMEQFISRSSALKPDRANPDTEFWFLYRREGFSVFMKRLTRSVEKRLRPGELPPALAWLLCKLGAPGPGETLIDPFCGYGAIPEAALKHFPVKKCAAFDIDLNCVKIARAKGALQNERAEIFRADAFAAPLPDEGADLIVTDPPWGMYEQTKIPLEEFYEKTLGLFFRLLKPGGRAVLLTAAEKETGAALEKIPAFSLKRMERVLVSGKKACVFLINKLVR